MSFQSTFGAKPDVTVFAPGRVNLLGEHTDYNDGFVLPTPLSLGTTVCASRNFSDELYTFSETINCSARWSIARRDLFGDWRDYVNGCLQELQAAGFNIGGAKLYISSNLPLGMGVSSSASLEVALLRAFRELYTLPMDDVTLARLAQRAEWNYAGVHCGLMDQMACSVGKMGKALFLDTQSTTFENITLPPGGTFVVIDSGIPRRLASSAYNARREECQEACRLLGIPKLRDVLQLESVEALPLPYRLRARHVVTENARVLEGCRLLRYSDWAGFGTLMNASHRSLCQDYEVSLPELDSMVGAALELGALGCRLTGAGFGGALVALLSGEVEPFSRNFRARFPNTKTYPLSPVA